MKVTDNVTAVVRVRERTEHFPIELTYVPRHTGDCDAVQIKYRGFRQACVLNPTRVGKYGTYELVLRFVDYFFSEFMGYGKCTVVELTE